MAEPAAESDQWSGVDSVSLDLGYGSRNTSDSPAPELCSSLSYCSMFGSTDATTRNDEFEFLFRNKTGEFISRTGE